MIWRAIAYVSLFGGLGWLVSMPAPAAELVLFESADCNWCEAWNSEIGEIYPKAAEARVAPLRRVDVHGDRPADLAQVRGIIYTPTFVLMEDGQEVGRITGYAGEEFFWGLLGIELQKLNGQARLSADTSASSAARVDEEGEAK